MMDRLDLTSAMFLWQRVHTRCACCEADASSGGLMTHLIAVVSIPGVGLCTTHASMTDGILTLLCVHASQNTFPHTLQ